MAATDSSRAVPSDADVRRVGDAFAELPLDHRSDRVGLADRTGRPPWRRRACIVPSVQRSTPRRRSRSRPSSTAHLDERRASSSRRSGRAAGRSRCRSGRLPRPCGTASGAHASSARWAAALRKRGTLVGVVHHAEDVDDRARPGPLVHLDHVAAVPSCSTHEPPCGLGYSSTRVPCRMKPAASASVDGSLGLSDRAPRARPRGAPPGVVGSLLRSAPGPLAVHDDHHAAGCSGSGSRVARRRKEVGRLAGSRASRTTNPTGLAGPEPVTPAVDGLRQVHRSGDLVSRGDALRDDGSGDRVAGSCACAASRGRAGPQPASCWISLQAHESRTLEVLRCQAALACASFQISSMPCGIVQLRDRTRAAPAWILVKSTL